MYIVAPFWILFSINLIIYYQFYDCVIKNDELGVIELTNIISVFIILLVATLIFLYFLFKNKDDLVDNTKSFEIISHQNSFSFGSDKHTIVVMPLYLLWLFAVSRIIVILHYAGLSILNIDKNYIFYEILILFILFVVGFSIWYRTKKYSNSKWSFLATIYALIYISLNVYWNNLYPFIKSYAKVIQCIFKNLAS